MKEFYSVWGPDGRMYYQESRKRGATHKALEMLESPECPISDEDRASVILAKLLDEKFDALLASDIIRTERFHS